MPNANVMKSAFFAEEAISPYQSRTFVPLRGEKIAVVSYFHGLGGAMFEAAAHVLHSAPGGSPFRNCQYCRYTPATRASATMWPQFEWPKIPFSVRFVDPVQTATGFSFFVRTKNLLCISVPLARSLQFAS